MVSAISPGCATNEPSRTARTLSWVWLSVTAEKCTTTHEFVVPGMSKDTLASGMPANAEEVVWAQDEPANQGAWSFVRPLLVPLLRPDQTLRYIGRDEAASPATGSYKIHQAEENAILDEAFKRARGLRAASADEPHATGERATG